MTKAVLALGSNLGERGRTILQAVRQIADLEGVELTAASSLHETVALTPAGPDPEAPPYLNAVVSVETTLTPQQLLTEANRIEDALGRVRGHRWADRTLDIDIIVFGDLELADEQLTIPHPRAAERGFVLAPWLEIEPDARLNGERVAELLARLEAR